MGGSTNSNELKVVGFGACMISGYPHQTAGFLEIACQRVENALSRPVRTNIVSLDGFPAPRAEKYLRSKVLKFSPNYVVLQFGATDVQCPIRNKAPRATGRDGNRERVAHRSTGGTSEALAFHGKPTNAFSRVRWGLKGLIGYLRRIKPVTPIAEYIAAIERMVCECQSAGAIAIVLSPFVDGSLYTTRYAAAYTKTLHQLRSLVPTMILIDGVELLRKFSKSQVLMHDGFHLSELGHQIMGEAIANSIMQT
jgi:lysophospholipase L1-like esterase